MMIERMLKEIAPGGVFYAFGHDYVVLDHNFASVAGESGVFCLDCGDVETSRFNPLDADEPNTYNSSYACIVWTDGPAHDYYVNSTFGCRPALLFHPETLVSCDGEGANHSALSGIPTDDLLKEISRRVQG